MVETYLAEEAETLREAIWLPLGPKPSVAIQHLVAKGVIAQDRVLSDLPHPSGANGERVAYFLGKKASRDLSRLTRPEPLDHARVCLIAQVQKMIGAH